LVVVKMMMGGGGENEERKRGMRESRLIALVLISGYAVV
jgi:hypothetical protein